MSTVCPTDLVNAPIDVVWTLLTTPSEWGDFYDMRRVVVDPPGPAAIGQHVRGESGPAFLHLKIDFLFTLLDNEHHRLRAEVRLPLGILVREDLDCVATSETQCRVRYHCDFEFVGLRGQVTRRLLAREVADGPANSLARLKAAAERRFRNDRR
jgi:hypothetical protein